MADVRESRDERVLLASVLTEAGELARARYLVLEVLEERAAHREALSLLAKIEHIRGDVPEAIACWAKLRARAPLGASALGQLEALLHLAADPERGAGEWVAVGQTQLAESPSVQLELEHAFGSFLRRRPAEARAACAQVAARYRARDANLYKLAVLAEARIAELSGELDAACERLEQLGREPGFAADPDRALLLARIYERLGGAERLGAASKLCSELAGGDGHLTVLGRLADLHRRLGQDDLGRSFEARFLAEFRRRMHRPTPSEVRQVASRHYVPLARLVAMGQAPEMEARGASERERGLELVQRGQLAAAAECLGRSTDLLDRKYAADAELLLGDAAAATRGYRAVLEAAPGDLVAARFLLGRYRQVGDPSLRELLASERHAVPIRLALEAELERAPSEPSLWYDLSTLHELDPTRIVEFETTRARALALEDARRRAQHPIGRALAVAAYRFLGVTHGVVHEVRAARDRAAPGRGGSLPASSIHGNLSPEMRRGIQTTFALVRRYARAEFRECTADISSFTYSLEIAKEDEPSYGVAAGLPCALAFLSVFLQVPLPQDVASSGALAVDAEGSLRVGPIGDSACKVRGAYNRNLRFVVLPEANRRELDKASDVPRSVLEQTVRYASDLRGAARTVLGEDLSPYARAIASGPGVAPARRPLALKPPGRRAAGDGR